MSDSASQIRTVTLSRVLDAPIELVHSAWAEAEHVTKWMKCDVQATLHVENWIPAVGAEFKNCMAQPGVFEAWTTGRFTEVDPPSALAWITHADPKLGVPRRCAFASC